jgi:hypothetical protein
MWAYIDWYWNYFWLCLWVVLKVYFGTWSTWFNIATFIGGNIYAAKVIAKTERKHRGWEDPNLIYSPKLDDYVSIERFNRVEGEWHSSIEDIPENERTWFQKAMLWLGLEPGKPNQ